MVERRSELEFSRTVEAGAVGEAGLDVVLEANAAERAALARRFGLIGLERLAAQARLERARGGRIRAKVTFDADVVQSCVVTLEPVASRVSEAFEASFADWAEAEAGGQSEVEVAFDEEDPPEPMPGGRIELGELVAQHLSLALDPYPRKPGVEFVADADAAEEKPFAALAKLASRRRS